MSTAGRGRRRVARDSMVIANEIRGDGNGVVAHLHADHQRLLRQRIGGHPHLDLCRAEREDIADEIAIHQYLRPLRETRAVHHHDHVARAGMRIMRGGRI